MLLATTQGGQQVIESLQLMSKASEAFDGLWKLFLMGELYRVISLSVLPLLLPFVVRWLYNSYFNSKHALDDVRRFTGDLWSYAMIGLIIIGIASSSRTGAMLYSLHKSANMTNQEYVDVAVRLAKDPGTSLATIVTSDVAISGGISQCDRIADPVKKEKCIQELLMQQQPAATSQQTTTASQPQQSINASDIMSGASGGMSGAAGFGTNVVGDNSSQVGNEIMGGMADSFVIIVLVPILMIVGTAFLMGLDLGALMFVLMTPWTLLMAISSPGKILEAGLKFFTWALVGFVYRVMVVGLGYVMISSDTVNTVIYAILVGLIGPFMAIQVVSGNTMGVFSGVGSVVSAVRRVT
jgi:hypothetical protein